MNYKKPRVLIVNDIVSAIVVWILFYAFRLVINDIALGREMTLWNIPSYDLLPSLISFPSVAVAVYAISGSYIDVRSVSRIKEFISTFVATFLITFVIFFAMLIDDEVVSYRSYILSFFVLWLLFLIITYTFRLVYIKILYHREEKGLYPANILIVGTGSLSQRALTYFNRSKSARNNHFVGFVSAGNDAECQVEMEQIIGSVKDLEKIVIEQQIVSVILALPDDYADINGVINRLLRMDVDIVLLPTHANMLMGRVVVDNLSSEPFINVTGISTMPWQLGVKRTLDIVASVIVGILLSPLLLYIAIRIKATSRGPVIYRQERIGRKGRPFTIYKFRTMVVDSEHNGPALTTEQDSRITPFGQTLRKYRLDELPQLWNIIRGDMSVVGPRPERRFFIDQIERLAPYYPLVYRVRPGLLSWGPIRVGYADTIEKMVERLHYDIVYIDNLSLTLDIKIMLYSLKVIFNGEGR